MRAVDDDVDLDLDEGAVSTTVLNHLTSSLVADFSDDDDVAEKSSDEDLDTLEGELTSKKQQIEFLKQSDPDFYAYLQKHDQVCACTKSIRTNHRT